MAIPFLPFGVWLCRELLYKKAGVLAKAFNKGGRLEANVQGRQNEFNRTKAVGPGAEGSSGNWGNHRNASGGGGGGGGGSVATIDSFFHTQPSGHSIADARKRQRVEGGTPTGGSRGSGSAEHASNTPESQWCEQHENDLIGLLAEVEGRS